MASGRVSVVTGASRGLGRGIALALGAAGDTVYVTGRSVDAPTGSWPGTIHETAEAITAAGGKGIAVACDHLVDEQTKAVFDRVLDEQGRLDVLVNNAFAMPDMSALPGNFWERELDEWKLQIDIGLRSSYVASYYGIPLLIKAGKGLIVNTSSPGAKVHLHPLPYGLSKIGHDKLAADMAPDVAPYGIAAISFWHGLVKTDRVKLGLEHFPQMFEAIGGTAGAETPEFGGRIIDAIWNDADMMRLSGGTFYTSELALHYGIVDEGGHQPISFRQFFGAPIFEKAI
ncbi:SDR family NAD(P)-dependent oxidoreductase [Zavarzinia sp.]|uniref:SDR family NAD(P)-dependent oxidoreductase n=1 Tax=Zavarzinia sp. TaxID=2027920 RepID=UPI00356992D7